MKSNNSIYSFFIVLSLLFWNPLSFYLVYGNELFPASITLVLYLVYTIVFLIGILLIYLIQKGKLGEKFKKFVFTLCFAGFLFAMFVTLDSIIGLIQKRTPKIKQTQDGLIFQPNSQARYRTVEFDYEAKINNLGLRDREIDIEKGDKYRILCFGDSWTFGWGVNLEDSWPIKLEQFLRWEKGVTNIEVINCGQGGAYTATYKKNMEKVIPVLKPDLVLVGILQEDDFVQLYENKLIDDSPVSAILKLGLRQRVKGTLQRYLKASFYNILEVTRHNESKIIDIKTTWKISANKKIDAYNKLQKLRFNSLEDTIQKLFKSGDLNPGLLKYYVEFHDYSIFLNNPEHSATRFVVGEMDKDLKDMKLICQENNCNLVVLNLPIDKYTGHKVIRTPSDVFNPYFEEINTVDSLYSSIASANGLHYIQLTEHFIALEDKLRYYFLFDGHPTEAGYSEIANYIGRQLLDKDIIKIN